MVSGLFSAKTVVHLSTAPATASFEHAVAVCTETLALNTSTTPLIPSRVCIISSLISSGDITSIGPPFVFQPSPPRCQATMPFTVSTIGVMTAYSTNATSRDVWFTAALGA
jgi:hypothetical protein